MKKHFIITFAATALFWSCTSAKQAVNNETEQPKTPCVENTMESCVCLEVYSPVCGCNNKTYTNSCHAECSGVTYVEGACKN